MPIAVALLLLGLAPDAVSERPRQHTLEARTIETGKPATGPLVAYEVRYVTVQDLNWRGKFDPFLKTVERNGGTTVWSVPHPVLKDLMTHWTGSTTTNILQAPKVVAPVDGTVELVNEDRVQYVAHLERIADGPINEATQLAFRPEVDTIRNGIRTRLSSGRISDQGLQTFVNIELDRLIGFQTSAYTESAKPAQKSPLKAQPAKVSATIQVPMVDSVHLTGDWLIPTNGALVVSLGAARTEGRWVRKVQPEQLLVITYAPTQGEPVTPARPSPTPAVTANPSLLRFRAN